jgi:branched-chain amino acid transport system ATP-binding protein
MTVLENILVALEAKESLWKGFLPWSKKTNGLRIEACRILSEVGLAHLAKEKAASLSGGQMRLLEIMRTVALGSELFLLDEPTAGVSPKMKDDVAKLIVVLQKLGKTVVIIEHDINFIQKFCSRIIVLDDGKIMLDDLPEKVRSDKRLNEIYFGECG